MKISVIVCTRNRSQELTGCLDSIAASIAQSGCNEAEIVLVDNGSTDDTSVVVSNWASNSTVPVQLVHEPRPGLSAARNCGIGAARGDLVVFTDDDCRLSPSYVSELLAYDAADTELVMRSGSVFLGDPNDLPLTVKSVDTVLRWQRPMDLAGEGQLLGGTLIGCNIAMRREILEKLGPFDENLGAGTACPAGEDTDYFYRAYLAGFRLEMVPDMVVRHFHGRREIAQRTRLLRNYAIGNGGLAIKYLLIYPNFSRHFLWELKACLRSAFTRRRPDAPPPWLPRLDGLLLMGWGAVLYTRSRMRRKLAPGSAS